MAKKKPTLVYPVPGFYLATVPALPHECADPFCVASGAFTPDPPPTVADTNPDDPPEGGSSDPTTED